MSVCRYNLPYYGPCGGSVVDGSTFCAEHATKRCDSCGAQATHGCSAGSSFICGAPLCPDCEDVSLGVHQRKASVVVATSKCKQIVSVTWGGRTLSFQIDEAESDEGVAARVVAEMQRIKP